MITLRQGKEPMNTNIAEYDLLLHFNTQINHIQHRITRTLTFKVPTFLD
jgi:hypothetical protein